MSSRLDRLILLLETGSTPSVRLTAARQLAQIATTRVAHQSQSSNNLSENWRGIEGEWGEVISLVTKIVVQLESRNYETRIATAAALALISKGVGIWDPTQSESIGSTSQLESPIDSTITGLFSLPEFNLNRLLTEGNLLLSSAGTEFLKTGNLSSVELAKAQKDTLGSLGLDDIGAEAIGIDLEAELAGNDAIKVEKQEGGNKLPPPRFKLEPGQPEFHLSSAINSNSTPTSGHSSSKPQPLKIKISKNTPISAPAIDSPSITPIDDDEDAYAGLSAREKNKLKRKRKSEAKAGGSSAISTSSTKVRIIEAPIISAPPISTPIIKEETKQETTGTGVVEGEAFIFDPGAKAKLRAQEQLNQGGEIAIDLEASKLSFVIEGEWPWKSIVAKLSTGLGSSKWEERHGAALGLKEILRLQGSGGGKIVGVSKEQNDRAHESWAEDLAVRLLCVFALDRFGDYISDQVIAPVRETAAQALATLLPQLSPSSIIEVKRVLVDMIEQNSSSPTKSIGYQSSSISKGKGKEVVDGKHIWQVRHAGLLGLKYLVAVRSDLLRSDAANEGLVMIKEENGDIKMKTSSELDLLKDVVDAALLGLRDSDDDVRSAAAATLTPIVDVLVEKLPVELEILIAVLWECLGDLKDDLSSSIGGIMDLLSRLLAFPSVLNLMKSPASLIPLLFPFFRHTISTVRLAVLKTILVFLQLPSLDYNFIDYKLFSLLFQNFIVEEKLEIVKATQETWIACLQLNVLNLTPTILSNWFAILYSKIGSPVNINLFWSSKISLSGQGGFAYNVDKSLLAGDLALVSSERIMKGKITACIALGELISFWPLATHDSTFGGFLSQGLESNSTLQRFLSSTVIEEWCSAVHKDSYTPAITAISSLASRLSQKLHLLISFEPLANYDELDVVLSRIQGECVNLQVTFEKQGKITSGQIKVSVIPGTFTINQAQQVLDSFPDVINLIPKTTRKSLLPTLEEKKKKLKIAVGYYGSLKDGYDRQVFAGIAGAIVATRVIPAKVSPIIRSITNSIKMEEDPHLQARSAHSITSFIAICSSPTSTLRTNPSEKVVKNLCTFLCQDLTRTPIFSLAKNATGIASLKLKPARGLVADGKMERKDSEADGAAKLLFRGATLALAELAKNFGEEMLEKVPKLWSCMSESLLRTYLSQDIKIADELLESDDSKGQDLLDCLTVLPIAAAELTPALNHRLVALFPSLALAISSKFSVIRYAAAKCFTSLCDIAPMEGLKHVVEDVIPILGDPLNVDNRRGAIELISHLVELLDIKILPYVIFLIVPVLGRMSDSDDEVRLVATNTFATLIKLVPLEAGLPDPPGFSSEMLAKRISEREFLAQLLDGKQVEEYKIPIKIDIELRKYQREGVSWLAFLAKYQLHGLLCDDMGLGKTLQSICILASKHFERAERHRETGSLDSVHLPTLIVCPPTLTGHWQQEIKTYATDLKPLIYTGPSVDRKKLIKSFNKYDVIITSYEIIRNDIESLHKIDFNYYILDEGHIIKNGKTKLTKAIKQIKSIHRLILSGTPIQNNVLELWSLFDFLMPGFLGSEKNFNDRFGKPIAASRDAKSSSKEQESGALALEALHKQVLPFLLRRLKEDVLDDLPPKIIQDYYCELSPLQKKLYDDFSNSGAKQSVNGELSGKGDGKGQHVFQALQYLRKLVNHPVLILKPDLPNHQAVISQLESEGSSLRDISHAPKLEALRQILLDCGIGTSSTSDFDSVSLESVSQHRVLIFCQLKQMLDLIENDLFKPLMPTVTYMRMDGTTDPSKRHGVVQTFNSDPSIDCLLLTTHVGGLGLNLTGADTVIFIEHDWNPMKDLQAMDRAHRLGQKKVVNVYRLIMRGTLEEKIMGLQRFKLNIASSVVTQQNSDLSSLGTDQILDLFNVSSTPLPPSKPSNKPIGQKAILEGLGDLPPEEEYGELDLNAFTDSLA